MLDRIDDSTKITDEGRYGLVIALVIVSYVIAARADSPVGWLANVLVQLFTIGLVFTVSGAGRARRVVAGVAVSVVVGTLLIAVGVLSRGDPTDSGASVAILVVLVVLYALTPLVIIVHVMRRPAVDGKTLLGGIAAYLLIGMTYAFGYVSLGVHGGGPFFGADGDGTTAQCLFFSFTTLTTTGYGNLVPAGNPGQTMAISEAVLGQLFLVAALGKIVSNTGRTRLPGREPRPPEADHGA